MLVRSWGTPKCVSNYFEFERECGTPQRGTWFYLFTMGENAKKEFRISAKTLFLTYSQVTKGTPLEEVYAALVVRLAPYTIENYIVAREEHKDGGEHWHCYLKLNRKGNFRGPNRLDIKLIEAGAERVYHGNYKAGKVNHIAYAKKDGDYITNMDDKAKYLELASAGEYDAACEAFAAKHPKEYVMHLQAIQKNLRSLATPTVRTPYYGPWSQSLTEATTGWDSARTSLIVSGPSGTGKTQYALTLGKKPLLVRHADMLRRLTPEHDLIVFDDMSFRHWPRESCIHLVDLDEEAQINIRYGVAVIPARTRRVFTTNEKMGNIFADDEYGAIKRRVKIHDMYPIQVYGAVAIGFNA